MPYFFDIYINCPQNDREIKRQKNWWRWLKIMVLNPNRLDGGSGFWWWRWWRVNICGWWFSWWQQLERDRLVIWIWMWLWWLWRSHFELGKNNKQHVMLLSSNIICFFRSHKSRLIIILYSSILWNIVTFYVHGLTTMPLCSNIMNCSSFLVEINVYDRS